MLQSAHFNQNMTSNDINPVALRTRSHDMDVAEGKSYATQRWVNDPGREHKGEDDIRPDDSISMTLRNEGKSKNAGSLTTSTLVSGSSIIKARKRELELHAQMEYIRNKGELALKKVAVTTRLGRRRNKRGNRGGGKKDGRGAKINARKSDAW